MKTTLTIEPLAKSSAQTVAKDCASPKTEETRHFRFGGRQSLAAAGGFVSASIIFSLWLLASAAFSADNMFSTPSQYKGKKYESFVSRQQFEATPSWNAFGTNEVPITVKKAVDLSVETLKQLIPSQNIDQWQIRDVNLCRVSLETEQKWLYIVSWEPPRTIHAQVEPDDFDVFRLVVVMNGECIKPTPKETKK